MNVIDKAFIENEERFGGSAKLEELTDAGLQKYCKIHRGYKPTLKILDELLALPGLTKAFLARQVLKRMRDNIETTCMRMLNDQERMHLLVSDLADRLEDEVLGNRVHYRMNTSRKMES
jgi:hypothetical protein